MPIALSNTARGHARSLLHPVRRLPPQKTQTTKSKSGRMDHLNPGKKCVEFSPEKQVAVTTKQQSSVHEKKRIKPTVQPSRHQDCPLCLEKFRSPRILPCFHTFCQECLTNLVKTQRRKDTFPCPTCRATIQVPAGGVGKFQVNFYLEAEVDALSLKNDLKCEACTRVAAAHKCFECNQLMCESCRGVHNSLAATKCHTVLSLNDATGSSYVIKRERYCDKHPREVFRFFCQQCRSVICRDCKLTSHEGHSTCDLSAKAASGKKLLSEVYTIFMNSLQPKLKEELQEARKHQTALPKKITEVRAVLTQKAEDIKKIVDKSLNEALAKLEQDAREVNKEVDEAVQEMELQLTSCQSLMEHAGRLAESGVDADVLALPSQLASFVGSSISKLAGLAPLRPEYFNQNYYGVKEAITCLTAFRNGKWRSSLEWNQAEQFPQDEYFYSDRSQTKTDLNQLAAHVVDYIGKTKKSNDLVNVKGTQHYQNYAASAYWEEQNLENTPILTDICNICQLLARWQ